MLKAVVSAAYGALHERLARVSYPTFERYAEKVGADFVPLTERRFPRNTPHFEKFQIREVLDAYDAVLWVDSDAVISRSAPSIFEIVPSGHFAAVDEGAVGVGFDPVRELKVLAAHIGLPYPETRPYVYFNSGVFVAWKDQKFLFDDPPEEIVSTCGLNEQTLLNLRVALSGTPFRALEPTWNMIWRHAGFERAHVVHFAGRKGESTLVEMRNLEAHE